MLAATARTVHRHLEIEGVRVFYRESLPDRTDAPVLLLLHGFPSASHQFRGLIDALGADYRLIAPDYPGSGHTQAPDDFTYSFDRLADITEGFIQRLGLDRFVMYVFDFGAPVGFRIAERHPEWIAGLVVQNGNAYADGLSGMARDLLSLTPDTPGAHDAIQDMLTLETTRGQYETGVAHPRPGRPGRLDPGPALPGPARPQGRPAGPALRLPLQRRALRHLARLAAPPHPAHSHHLGCPRPLLHRAGRPRLPPRPPRRRTPPPRHRPLRPGDPPGGDRPADRRLRGPRLEVT